MSFVQFLLKLFSFIFLFGSILSTVESRTVLESTIHLKREYSLDHYSLPLGDGVQTLPALSSGLALQLLGLEAGYYNYECISVNGGISPIFLGVNATIYNVSIAHLTESQFHELPGYLYEFPYGDLYNNTLTEIGYLEYINNYIPRFELGPEGCFIGELNATIEAPDSKNIDWAKWTARRGSVGFKEIYVVETVGGVIPASCYDELKNVSVSFTAELWFYN
ncbi:MAG: hypothetical protein M1834_007968 [Cirrosporium novae-zelandiae]|nr:MAG: hypothetical protein M1834_007968 [Cirrosporium novae-zelandiae]